MNQSIAQKFSFLSLVKFTAPTMIMMIFLSLYTIVDGVFVSRFIGTDALSAVNIVYPMVSLVIAIAVMLSSGGSAIVARKMGEGNPTQAKKDFTMFVGVALGLGILIALFGIFFLKPILVFSGASEALMGYCVDYLKILVYFFPASVLQMVYQTFFVTSGKPELGLILTILSGVTNIILDYVFIVLFQMGISGAAWGTVIGQLIPAVCGTIYFFNKKLSLHFTKIEFCFKTLQEGCFNGSSEMVTNLSTSVTTLLFNIFMMKYAGEKGVAAITIVLYSQFLFTALFLGFSNGVAPVISFHYGSKNSDYLKRIYKICKKFIIGSSFFIFFVSLGLAKPVVHIFAKEDIVTYQLAVHGFLLFSINFLFAGINIFASSMFTAFSDGKTSAIISFLRTFVFIVLGITILPLFLEKEGVWLAIPFAELMTWLVSVYYLKLRKVQFQYA